MGADGKAVVAASRQAFVDGMTPALYLGAAVALAAAIFTALRGPKTAAEAEPRLHLSDHSEMAGAEVHNTITAPIDADGG